MKPELRLRIRQRSAENRKRGPSEADSVRPLAAVVLRAYDEM